MSTYWRAIVLTADRYGVGWSVRSMLEEAAGTRLFEQKKEAALKTIEKKSKKVEEITTVSWHRLR